MEKEIKVLLVDDNEVVRQGLRYMLESEKDMTVVADCGNAEDAFSRLKALSPDVVLIDAQMPGLDGIQATWKMKRNGLSYDGDVIVLGECMDHLVAAMEAGAAGYLLKNINRDELTEAIRQVSQVNHPDVKGESFGDSFVEQVELVISPHTDAAQILRFVGQVEERFNVNVMHTVGSKDWGTVVTIAPGDSQIEDITDRLRDIPDVEGVEEEQPKRNGLPNFLKRFGFHSRSAEESEAASSKRIVVNMRETVASCERLVAALN